MNAVRATSSRGLSSMQEAAKLLRKQLGELSISLSVWDHVGELADGFEPSTEFCRAVRDAEPACLGAARTLAGRIVADGKPARLATPCGGYAVGVPVFRRRRLIGAAVACLPVQTSLEEESLARLCDRLQLDRQHMAALAAEVRAHGEIEAGHYQKILQWLLERDQAAQIAEEELGTLSANLASTYEELSLVYRLSGAMRVTEHSRDFLDRLCRELCEVVHLQAATALVYAHPAHGKGDAMVVAGDPGMTAGQWKLLVQTQIVPRIAGGGRALLDNDFAKTADRSPAGAPRNVIAVPLLNGSEAIGVLAAVNKTAGDFDSVDLKLINSLGSQASVFLSNRQLYADLQDLLMGVLNALTASIDAKDPYTCGHSQRVALLARRLAEACGFPAERVERIYLSGLLHDVGKIGVPESTLCKNGKLTAEEFANMKRHPDVAASILGGIRRLDDVIVGVRSHHERYDGRGYPSGLAGEGIPIEGRILGLADSFDAMTSHRTYRNALPLEQVVAEIRSHAGTQFDPTLVEIFLSWDLPTLLAEARQVARSVLEIAQRQEARA